MPASPLTSPGVSALDDETGQLETAALFAASAVDVAPGSSSSSSASAREVALREAAASGVSALVVGRLATVVEAQAQETRGAIRELAEQNKALMLALQESNRNTVELAREIIRGGTTQLTESFKLAAGVATQKSELPAELTAMLVTSLQTGADYRVIAAEAQAKAEKAESAQPKTEAELQYGALHEIIDMLKSTHSGKPSEGALKGFLTLMSNGDERAKKAAKAAVSSLDEGQRARLTASLMELFAD